MAGLCGAANHAPRLPRPALWAILSYGNQADIRPFWAGGVDCAADCVGRGRAGKRRGSPNVPQKTEIIEAARPLVVIEAPRVDVVPQSAGVWNRSPGRHLVGGGRGEGADRRDASGTQGGRDPAQGEVVLRIDPTEYELQVAQLEAEVAQIARSSRNSTRRSRTSRRRWRLRRSRSGWRNGTRSG